MGLRTARTIPVDDALAAAAILREAVPGTTFAVELLDGFGKEPEFMPRLPPPADLSVGPLEDVLDDTAVKLLARHDDMEASTLEMLCQDRDIAAAEVVAFGDMPNDLPMLEWAGTSYAMANAHPTVQELADHVAPSNEDDGVAAVLEELFGL